MYINATGKPYSNPAKEWTLILHDSVDPNAQETIDLLARLSRRQSLKLMQEVAKDMRVMNMRKTGNTDGLIKIVCELARKEVR